MSINDAILEEIAELRQYALASSAVLQLLERRKREAFGRLMQRHKSGEDTLSVIAELSAFNDLEMEIRQKTATYEALERKHNGKQP